MRESTVGTVLLLYSLGWISVSGSDVQTVEAQPGEDVTLMCSNYTSVPTSILWFRVVKKSKSHCVSSMFSAVEPASLCSGFQDGRFETSSNVSILFLKIKRVNVSDSGLYFCGYIASRDPVIVSATYLEVQETSERIIKLTSVILGALTVLLIVVVIYLVVKIKKIQKAADAQEQNPQPTDTTERQGSDDLNYAAVTFHPKIDRQQRPAPDREVDQGVIYSTGRETRETPEATRVELMLSY